MRIQAPPHVQNFAEVAFNTPFEMLGDKDMTEYELSQRLTFQYSV